MSKSVKLKKNQIAESVATSKPEPEIQPEPVVASYEETQDPELGEDELGEDELGEDELGEDELGEDEQGENEEDYSDYLIRQQQVASYQMLCQFLVHNDKNVTETLNDIRVSLDSLTKCVLHMTKVLDRHLVK